MKSCWIFCCFFGLTLGQSQMIDIKCPENHFLGTILTNVSSGRDTICITCDRLYSAEAYGNSSQYLIVCYKNIKSLKTDSLSSNKTDLTHLTIGDLNICGLTFDAKNESMSFTGAIACAHESYKKKNLERGSILCPPNSTLKAMFHRERLRELCIRCKWDNPLRFHYISVCTRKSMPEDGNNIYTDSNNSRCILTNCSKDELKYHRCGYKVATNLTSFKAHKLRATNLIPCSHGRTDNQEVIVCSNFHKNKARTLDR